jgi:predicted HTH transcriptional regulator
MFDSAEELQRKIQLGEDNSLELKEIRFRGNQIFGPSRSDLADEISAIANTSGAVLVLGVDDKSREILGISIEKLDIVEDYIREITTDTIKPPVIIRVYRMELADSTGTKRPVLKVDIPRSLFVHKSPGGYFYRQGSAKWEMAPDLLARLFQQRSQARIIRFEEQSVPGTEYRTLHEDLWGKFLSGIEGDPETILIKRNLLTHDDEGIIRASVAGVLMCSVNPEHYLPGAFIEAVSYRGTEHDSNYQVDAKQIFGPLDLQIRDAMTFFKRNNYVGAKKVPERIDYPRFSEKAVFEAIVNAIAHRDYSISGSKIRFFIFSDRLEIYSPGSLPNTLTLESLAFRQVTRNELITKLLSECPVEASIIPGRRHFMEKRGEGVPIILKEGKLLSHIEPTFTLIDNSELLLTLYAALDPSPGK